jgi:hypothetical protein
MRILVDRLIYQGFAIRQGGTPRLISQTPGSWMIRMKKAH